MFEEEDYSKTTHEEKKILFHQDNALCHKIEKFNELGLDLLLYPPRFTRFISERPLALCRFQKNAPGRKILLE